MARTGSKVVLNLSTPDSMKHVEPGDFIAHLRSFQGGLERSDLTGKVSSAYTVIEPLASVESTYFRWVLKSRPFIEELSSGLEQLRDGQSIKFGDFTANSLPMPPREEQRRIADFLDDRVARIDQIIAAQRKQIDNLLEWIASAVNGLLTPQQGVGQWLRVKDVSSKVGSGKTPRGGADAYLDEGVAFLRSQNVHNDGLRLDDVAFISTEIDEEMSSTRVREGDVLLNITGGSLGRCCVADGRALPANVSQHVCIIRPTAINPSHLALLIRSKVVQDQIRLAQVGGNREGLNFEQARELRFWHPEDATVWSRCRYWEKQGTEGVAMIGHAVSLLQSYKQALITAAVTGELDVTTAGS
jgi:type I restriction enzyme S subunit